MKKTRMPGIPHLVLAAALAAPLSFTACKAPRHHSSAKAQTYTIRGQVVQVPAAGNPGSELLIHHQAIPGFVDKSGQVVGMESMTMDFTPAKGLSLSALKPGDKIEFVLSVDWPNDNIVITNITKLPETAPLDFGGQDSTARDSG